MEEKWQRQINQGKKTVYCAKCKEEIPFGSWCFVNESQEVWCLDCMERAEVQAEATQDYDYQLDN